MYHVKVMKMLIWAALRVSSITNCFSVQQYMYSRNDPI